MNYNVIKIAKTVRIFMEIEHIKNRGVKFSPERIGALFPMLWSSGRVGPLTQGEIPMERGGILIISSSVSTGRTETGNY